VSRDLDTRLGPELDVVVEEDSPDRRRTDRLLPLGPRPLEQAKGLEQYLVEASIRHTAPLAGGGGHPQRHKMTVFLAGGIAAVAKAGADSNMLKQARREVAAWVLAAELEFHWLVPTTVLRRMPAAINDETEVDGSVQILWPRFSTALERRIDASYVDDVYALPLAVFDVLAANTDRKPDNWGMVSGVPNAVLIDHGHAFADAATDSEFAVRMQDHALSPKLLSAVEHFVERRSQCRIASLLDESETDGVYCRAAALADAKNICI
jgi:hypothetical protein